MKHLSFWHTYDLTSYMERVLELLLGVYKSLLGPNTLVTYFCKMMPAELSGNLQHELSDDCYLLTILEFKKKMVKLLFIIMLSIVG